MFLPVLEDCHHRNFLDKFIDGMQVHFNNTKPKLLVLPFSMTLTDP